MSKKAPCSFKEGKKEKEEGYRQSIEFFESLLNRSQLGFNFLDQDVLDLVPNFLDVMVLCQRKSEAKGRVWVIGLQVVDRWLLARQVLEQRGGKQGGDHPPVNQTLHQEAPQCFKVLNFRIAKGSKRT